jgi:hypothetical protein
MGSVSKGGFYLETFRELLGGATRRLAYREGVTGVNSAAFHSAEEALKSKLGSRFHAARIN